MRILNSLRRIIGFSRGGGEQVIREGEGAGLRFDPGNSEPGYVDGTNELPVQAVLAKYLESGSVFYDVGANVGFFTVIGARIVGLEGAVFAFEPVPANTTLVRSNSKRNMFSNVTVVQKAVADVSGKAELTLAEYVGGAALSSVPAPPDATGRINVDLVSLDDMVYKHGAPAPSMVKIDVEGAELLVLQGMEKTLMEIKPVVLYELDDEVAESLQSKVDACEQFMRAHGYQLTILEDSYPHQRWLVRHILGMPD